MVSWDPASFKSCLNGVGSLYKIFGPDMFALLSPLLWLWFVYHDRYYLENCTDITQSTMKYCDIIYGLCMDIVLFEEF